MMGAFIATHPIGVVRLWRRPFWLHKGGLIVEQCCQSR